MTILDSWDTPGGAHFIVTSHVNTVSVDDMERWRVAVQGDPSFARFQAESSDEQGPFDARTFLLMEAEGDVGKVVDLNIRSIAAWAATYRRGV